MSIVDQNKSARVRFSCHAPTAGSVFLFGKLGRRKADMLPMKRDDDGEWSAVLELLPGLHRYKFLVVCTGVLNVPEDCPALMARCDAWN